MLSRLMRLVILSNILLLMMIAAEASAADSDNLRIWGGEGQVGTVDYRGRWSVSSDDNRIDLAERWTAVTEDGADLGQIDMPFAWDDWNGRITLTRRFVLPDTLKDRSYRLVISGFAEFITIILNDIHLDTRRGDEIAFQLELDPRLLNFGSGNKLCIILDNKLLRRGSIPIYSGVYARRRYGGIHQDIYLICSPHTYITDNKSNWVETDTLNERRIVVETELRRTRLPVSDSTDVSYKVEYLLLDQDKNILTRSLSENIIFPASGVLYLTSVLPQVELMRWGRTAPTKLYHVYCQLTGAGIRHSSTATMGIRLWEVKDKGFSLNDEHLWLRCISYVPTQAGRGIMMDSDRIEADITMMKELGVDAVRILSGSASLYFLEMCEKNGLLVFVELPVFQVPDGILADADLIRSASEQFQAIILRDGRFTCIAGWGIGAWINPPNKTNTEYYRQLTKLAHDLDDRPVFASIPFTQKFTVSPLDFIILELPLTHDEKFNLPESITGDRPMLLGGIRRAVLPGNLGGYADPTSEAGQADYIIRTVQLTERLNGCAGIIVGDFADWNGATPFISGPLQGTSYLYATGLTNIDRNPRLAFHHLKEYWASGRVQPLSRGNPQKQDGGLLIIVGLAMVVVLFITARQNNIFKINLIRTFTSSRGFFQDISDRRFFQTGHTFLLTVLMSGGLALVATGWMFAIRSSYALDWLLSFILGDTELLKWAAYLIWQPPRSLIFFWCIFFILVWLASVRVVILCRLIGRRCSLAQGINLVTWSSAGLLTILPIGIIARRLFEASLGWLILSVLAIVIIWSHFRLVTALSQHTRRKAGTILLLWSIGPLIVILAIIAGLEYTMHLSYYWTFFWETISG